MDKKKQSFAYFVGSLSPVGDGTYQLLMPYDGSHWHIDPHDSQELRVYIEKKDEFRLAPVMPT